MVDNEEIFLKQMRCKALLCEKHNPAMTLQNILTKTMDLSQIH